MKRWTLLSIILLCLACAAENEPVEKPAEAPLENSGSDEAPVETESGDPEPASEEPVFTARSSVSIVVPEDWIRINEYTRMFYDGELDALHANFSAEAKLELPLAALTGMRNRMLRSWGRETEQLALKKEENEGYRAYKRAAKFSNYEGLVEVAWLIGPDDSIAGLFVNAQDKPAE